jgi:cation/acetate symporter
MIYEPSWIAVAVFLAFVGTTLAISFYFGSRAKSAQGYFAAHGQIPWFVNGIAFAGDYLSAASFLGICGMIAFYGYDGFLYSIGYLAGWIVALFIIAEPMKRLGKFTFADALDAKFSSPGIKLAAGISTLAVSVFYLIPQMVGAGALIQPLLGFPHWVGVVLVGATVVLIVVTAGMVSTTYVQFLKGFLLVIFSMLLTYMVLQRGFTVKSGGIDGYDFLKVGPLSATGAEAELLKHPRLAGGQVLPPDGDWGKHPLVRVAVDNKVHVIRRQDRDDGQVIYMEAQTMVTLAGKTFVNGEVRGKKKGEAELHPTGFLASLPDGQQSTGPLGPISFFRTLQNSEVVLWNELNIKQVDGTSIKVFSPRIAPGSQILRPGEHPVFKGIRSPQFSEKLNFLSLMLALFCGTASLPHILIRYYTVKDESSARKSTIVGIGSIGFFYVLTLYMGLGAMTSGALDVSDSNMAAPLLAQSISEWLFAIISAIAFTTVLGTVSGLILASSGAVTHDLLTGYFGLKLDDFAKVRVAKIAAAVVGAIAIALGILFREMNVNYLVGWAFSVAASANLPSLVMLLFWKGTTRQGIIAAVTVGMISSLTWILLSADSFSKIYGIDPNLSPMPFSQPGIATIPLGFLTLVVVSLMTSKMPSRDSVINHANLP